MASTLKKRLDELELRALNEDVRPALVLVIGEEGLTASQVASEAAAIEQGTQVIRIDFQDASRAAIGAE